MPSARPLGPASLKCPIMTVPDMSDSRRKLDKIRRGIDRVDDAIVRQLARRRRLVLELAQLKREFGIPIFDRKREQALVERVRRWGKQHGLNEEFVEVLFRLIVMNSKEMQYHDAF